MGPRKASEIFLNRHPEAVAFEVILYGSLAATGKGHLTDVAILDTLQPHAPVEIVWKPSVFLSFHPNGMTFRSKNSSFTPRENLSHTIHFVQFRCLVERLPFFGQSPSSRPLNLRRKASSYYIKAKGYKDSLKSRGLVFAYALAVSEENASGGRIVTAPTCGSCGVVPAVLYHLQKSREFSDTRILRALATAGLVGNIVKQNASISGAEVGCQGEVGVACAMASAAASQLFGGSPAQIEYAAEMGLEHHLGMTCDPVCGLVQMIPCIERNAYAAARALDANIYSAFTDGSHRVSFDKVVAVMKQTGHDLPSLYKETGEGGLAKDYEQM